MSHIWYPYTQHKTMPQPLLVRSASGIYLELDTGERLIDAISSWWAVIHGYKHPKLDKAATKQLSKLSHVMLGGLTHEPAQRLATLLADITPGDIQQIFFSDSGSVGCEVALKLAIQYWQNKEQFSKKKIVAFKKAYHGDTTGVMSVSDPDDSFHSLFKPLLLEQYFLDAPSQDNENDAKKAALFLDQHHTEIAAIIIEPLLQAAGGFNMYPPEFLRRLRQLCDEYNILLILDEVATGFGRTGTLFACNQANIVPDIMILGKGLTGGYIGLSATCVRKHVFEAFYSDNPKHAFMHGPTFMGNPLACAIAYESVRLFLDENYLTKIKNIEIILKERLQDFKHPAIKNTRVLGATGVIEVHNQTDIERAQDFARKHGVWLRPFDRYLYTMPPYIIDEKSLHTICDVMCQSFTDNAS
jgi:adenosylmethionine-8-amino-7-oxononanoate aminotransferase